MKRNSNKDQKIVGLLYDSVSSNTGDIAIGLALQQQFKKAGVTTKIVDPFNYNPSDFSVVIVGGGQLLRDPGDNFYDSFRLPGKHILNSVGVSGSKAFDYLDDYLYVSARSNKEALALKKSTNARVEVTPCTTTLLESPHFDIKGLHIQPEEKVVGIHLVPDALIMCPNLIDIINKIPHKKVFIPFTHYNQDMSFMKNLPFDKTNSIMLGKLDPLELHSAIGQMDYVVVSSLHATIFAYSQNIPFATMHQDKVFNYLSDRGLEEFIFKDQEQLSSLLKTIDEAPIDMSKRIDSDKKAARLAVDTFTKLIDQTPYIELSSSKLNKQKSELLKLKLEVSQLEGVVEKRDILTHDLIYQNMRSTDEKIKPLHEKITKLEKELQSERARHAAYWVKKGLKKVHNRRPNKNGTKS